MSQPPPFNRSADYSADAAASAAGRSTIDPSKLDAELDAIEATLDETLSNLAQIQRDDGALRDNTVQIHTLASNVRALFAASGVVVRGAWLTATAYALRDIVTQGGATYICAIAHTAGVFATDLAANRWLLLANSPSAFAASSISVTPAGGIASTNAQAALQELDTEKVTKAANLSDVADAAAARANLSALGLGGGTLTGPLVLPGAPTLALQAATKGYADGVVLGMNAGQCYFGIISSTQCRLVPQNGNKIFINGEWLNIPSVGVNLANTGALLGGGSASANNVYNVYAFNNGGTPALIMGPQARTTDATFGHQVATGFASHTLVGKVRLDGSGLFYDNTEVGVLSWFNRRRKTAYRGYPLVLTDITTQSFTTLLGGQVSALTWGQDPYEVFAISNGVYSAGGVGNVSLITVFDGVATGFSCQGSAHASNYYVGLNSSAPVGASEGNHTFGAAIAVGTGNTFRLQSSAVYAGAYTWG